MLREAKIGIMILWAIILQYLCNSKQASALLAAGAKPNESACMRIAEAAAGSAIATHVRIIDKIQVFDYNIIGASATLAVADS